MQLPNCKIDRVTLLSGPGQPDKIFMILPDDLTEETLGEKAAEAWGDLSFGLEVPKGRGLQILQGLGFSGRVEVINMETGEKKEETLESLAV